MYILDLAPGNLSYICGKGWLEGSAQCYSLCSQSL